MYCESRFMTNNPTFYVKFYGTRGSIPVCEPDFQAYGGNTTCIYMELRRPGKRTIHGIIDAGTGIRRLGKELLEVAPDNIFITFTHFHWDHIQGFPFFAPGYRKDQKIIVLAPKIGLKAQELKNIFEIQMQKKFFPVQLDEMGAAFEFIAIDDFQTFTKVDGIDRFMAFGHQHPGGAFSYRMDSGGKSLVVSTDIEHDDVLDDQYLEFCRGADVLVHDAQFTDDELKVRKGWGHSSYRQAIEVAKRANVKKLILTHHDPEHDDEFLKKQEKLCQEQFPNSIFAKDQMELIL